MPGVAYNPDDPYEQAFLSSLALGETGGASNAATLGTGGTDLASVIAAGNVDQYGFPIWSGQGNSHAAGEWQFQPGTWDNIAQEYHLDFSHPFDQAAGAWYLAEQSDPTLYSDLQSGNYGPIQAALTKIWPSVTGNGAAPAGLANDLQTAVGITSKAAATQTATNNASNGTPSQSSGGSSGATWYNPATWGSAIVGTFSQGALIVIGAVIIFVALWMLLSSQGMSPKT